MKFVHSLKNFFTKVNTSVHSTKVTVAVLVLLAISVPIALYSSGQQQHSKQEAASALGRVCGFNNVPACPLNYTCKMNSTAGTGGTCVPKPPTICQAKTDYLLILDVSDSMKQKSGNQTKIEAAVTSMDSFITLVSQGIKNKIGFVTFAQAGKLEQALTDNYQQVKAAIKSAAGQLAYRTCTQCGIDVAKGEEVHDGTSTNNKIAILVTDGEANWTETMNPPTPLNANLGKQAAIQAALSAHKTDGISFYTIGVGTPGKNADFSFLKQIANETGGKFFYATNSDSLLGIYKQIANVTLQNAAVANSLAPNCRPTPTCTPRPICKPGMMCPDIMPRGGWCPITTPTCTPRPPQCEPGSKLGIVCPAEPNGGWCPPIPSCIPRPKCLDATPRCMISEPAQGWCPVTSPTPTPTCTPRPVTSCTGGVNCKIPVPPPGGWCGSPQPLR